MTDRHTKPWLEKLTAYFLREPKNQEELLEMLRDANAHQLIDQESLDMMESVMEFSEMKVDDILVPRSHMIVVEGNATVAEALPLIIESKHSRYPVVHSSRNEIIGILFAKDLLAYAADPHRRETKIEQLARSATLVPETKRLHALLKDFRVARNHMAIVVDEYGAIAGLVTIQDLLEEIVGDIRDEYAKNETETNIEPLGPRQFSVKALTPIEELNQFLQTHFNDEEHDTVGGLVIKEFGRVPQAGEKIRLGAFLFQVVDADKRRIRRLQVTGPANEEGG